MEAVFISNIVLFPHRWKITIDGNRRYFDVRRRKKVSLGILLFSYNNITWHTLLSVPSLSSIIPTFSKIFLIL